ncbi:MAG: hypothetical protein NC548_24685 [Lachnospiraceae bacterium]|nr:hypothetical protein [Lachnospiraceae bacterium]
MANPTPSKGSWKTTFDMGAMLEFLHAFPYTDASHRLKKSKSWGSYGVGNREPAGNRSASLCTCYCRIAILYGFGVFTWDQAMSWQNLKDAWNTMGTKHSPSASNMNMGLYGVGFDNVKPVSNWGGATGAISACQNGQIPAGTPVHTYNHGHIWGGDKFISDFVENNPVRAGQTDKIHFPDSGVNVINTPSGVNYSSFMDGSYSSDGNIMSSNLGGGGGGYVSPGKYTPVEWAPPNDGGTKIIGLTEGKKGSSGMVIGIHINQK